MPTTASPDIGPCVTNNKISPMQQSADPRTSDEVTGNESAASSPNEDTETTPNEGETSNARNVYGNFPFDVDDLIAPDPNWIILPNKRGNENEDHDETPRLFSLTNRPSTRPLSSSSLALETQQTAGRRQGKVAAQKSNKKKVANSSAGTDSEPVLPIFAQSSGGPSSSSMAREMEEETQPTDGCFQQGYKPRPKKVYRRPPTWMEEAFACLAGQSPSSPEDLFPEESFDNDAAIEEPDFSYRRMDVEEHLKRGSLSESDLLRYAEAALQYLKFHQSLHKNFKSAAPSVTQEKALHEYDFSAPSFLRRIRDQMLQKYLYKGSNSESAAAAPTTGDDIFDIESDSDEVPETPLFCDTPEFRRSKLRRLIDLRLKPSTIPKEIYDEEDSPIIEHYLDFQLQRRSDEVISLNKVKPSPNPVQEPPPESPQSTSRKRSRPTSTTAEALGIAEEEEDVLYDNRYSQPSMRQTARKAARVMSEVFQADRGSGGTKNGKAQSSAGQNRKRKQG